MESDLRYQVPWLSQGLKGSTDGPKKSWDILTSNCRIKIEWVGECEQGGCRQRTLQSILRRGQVLKLALGQKCVGTELALRPEGLQVL